MVTRSRRPFAMGLALLLAAACDEAPGGDTRPPEEVGGDPDEPGDRPGSTDDDGDDDDDGDVVVVDDGVDAEGCPRLFAQDHLPVWRVELSDPEWAALQDEFLHRQEREAQGLDPNPYHPVEAITYEDGTGTIEAFQVLIRLKGQSSWVHWVELEEDPKMQFVIAFNEIDPDGRFLGVRKVELDMPRTDWTFLRQRLGLHTIRHIGQPAQCANNAVLYINGEYYGLYTHLERLDKEFLQRVYGKEGDADDGDLWKAAQEIRTNEDSFSADRIDALWGASSAGAIGGLAPLDDALFEWATEAVLPHSDGYHFGRQNFFLYDHPARGFLWIPSDIDTGFDYSDYYIDLFYPRSSRREYWYWIPYSTVLNDPTWAPRYVDTIAAVRDLFDPDEQAALLDAWAAQIETAAAADSHGSFTIEDHEAAIASMRDYLYQRYEFLGEWVSCRRSGAGHDWDADGTMFCFDCDEERAEVHPGAVERCNALDDDCDGAADEGVSCP